VALLPLPLYLLWPPTTSGRGAACGRRRKVPPRVPLAQGPAGLAAGVAGVLGRALPALERGSGYPTAERGQATPQQRRAQEKRKGKGGKTTNVLPTGTNEFL